MVGLGAYAVLICHAFKYSKYVVHHLAEIQYGYNRRFDLCAQILRMLNA